MATAIVEATAKGLIQKQIAAWKRTLSQ
jgi:hypothetical protein